MILYVCKVLILKGSSVLRSKTSPSPAWSWPPTTTAPLPSARRWWTRGAGWTRPSASPATPTRSTRRGAGRRTPRPPRWPTRCPCPGQVAGTAEILFIIFILSRPSWSGARPWPQLQVASHHPPGGAPHPAPILYHHKPSPLSSRTCVEKTTRKVVFALPAGWRPGTSWTPWWGGTGTPAAWPRCPHPQVNWHTVLGSLNRQMFYNLVSIYWPSFILRSNSFHDDLLFNP